MKNPPMTEALKQACHKRDNNKCVKCGSDYKIVCDHIVSLIDGGKNLMDNLQTLCDDCHKEKTKMEAQKRLTKPRRRVITTITT